MLRTGSILAMCALASTSLAQTPSRPAAKPPVLTPPPTKVEPVTDEIHGTKIADAYRWLEGDNAADGKAMGTMNSEVAAWTDAQNAYTRDVLDNLPGRKDLEARLKPLMEIGGVSTPAMRGNRYFYSKREGTQNQAIVYLREGHDGTARPLLDPNTLDAQGLVTVSWYVPSHDGELLAFGMYRAGDENSTLYLMRVDSGEWLAEEIPGKVGGVSWLPDSTGFLYRNLADLKNPYSGQVKFHRLGTHHRMDRLLIAQTDLKTVYGAAATSGYSEQELKGLATTYGPWAGVSRDGRWMLVGYSTGTRSNDLWVADFDRWMRTGDLALVPVLTGTLKNGASGSGPIVGDTMFMETTLDAPNGRVVAVDLINPGKDGGGWKEIIPESKDAVIQSVSAARGLLVVDYLQNASTKIERYAYDGKSLGAIELPGIGSAGVATEEDRTEAFLAFESYNEPDSIYRIDLKSGERALWERPAVPVDPTTVEVKQVWYSSKDGTKVSMFVVHKKGLKLDGSNPTILYGYGGFTASMTPGFSPTLFPWFEDGGVYAVANLRGGGEYGESWHRGGMLDKKQNVFDDFIAAGEWLVQNGYTNPKKLGIAGGSNGGLLTGAAVVQRPDLFSAAMVAVPLLDMVRYDKFLMARYWVPEYGSADDKDQFAYIFKYSPYHNIKQGTKYPAVLLTAGENDARVHPLHARKMAAALQAATASDPSEEPVLLWVDREAGHGQGKPLNLRVRDAADQRMFFMWQLGMLDGKK